MTTAYGVGEIAAFAGETAMPSGLVPRV